MIQDDLEGKKKDAHWGDRYPPPMDVSVQNPEPSRVIILCYLQVLVRYCSVPNLVLSLVINAEGSRLFILCPA